MNPDLEAQDEKGYTSLHLAIKNVEAVQSTKHVRALLTKGASRSTTDNEGKNGYRMISSSL
jgi:ankyrin repeat protein